MANYSSLPPVPRLTGAADAELSRRPREPRDFVQQMDDDFLSCRTEGHRFPKMRRGNVPRGIRPVRMRDGSFQITYICPDCGTEKTRLTLPGGGFDRSGHNSYRYPPGYQSPRGAGLRKGDFIDEHDSRVLTWLPARAVTPEPDAEPEKAPEQ